MNMLKYNPFAIVVSKIRRNLAVRFLIAEIIIEDTQIQYVKAKGKGVSAQYKQQQQAFAEWNKNQLKLAQFIGDIGRAL